MGDTVENLILDLLEWVALRDRTYEEVLDAWRTSCPRLPIWEEANDRGLLQTPAGRDGDRMIRVSPLGVALLEKCRLPSR